MSSTITAIILTYNEQLHIERCILSLQNYVDEIVVVDSYSQDKTVDIASSLGAKVWQHTFINQALQFNWALDNCNIKTDWVFRIDADEYLDNKNQINIRQYLSNLSNDINGLIISRKIVFLRRELLHGGWYPKWNLRIFRTGKGRCEERWMDEHIVLSEGNSVYWKLDIVDENLNDLTWWIAKHNNYSNREAADYFFSLQEQEEAGVKARFWGNEAERKRWLKNMYLKFPFFIRPFLNFLYRYVVRGGFRDGKQGLIWHFLQGFWYRFLVDAKIWEIKRDLTPGPSPGGEGSKSQRKEAERERMVAWLKDKYKTPNP